MATTKKTARKGNGGKKTPAAPAPKSDATVAAEAGAGEKPTPKEKAKPKKTLAPKVKKVVVNQYHIYLKEGASYGVGGFNFTQRRPVVTTDPAVYEQFRYNGRLRIVIIKGGG